MDKGVCGIAAATVTGTVDERKRVLVRVKLAAMGDTRHRSATENGKRRKM